MTSSLVGSEMCIRDRPMDCRRLVTSAIILCSHSSTSVPSAAERVGWCSSCLLYTSDAADDM
eukprot:7581026-Prorocentrum_lima.AAC.1